MTIEDNGDVVVDCAEDAYPGNSELTVTYQLRFFAASSTGWLARTAVTIQNSSDTDVPLTSPQAVWMPSDRGGVAVQDFLTSSGETLAPAPTDSWFMAGSPTGESVMWTSAWARTGATAASGLVVDGAANWLRAVYSAVTVPAGGAVRLVHFTNMVIPTAVSTEAAAEAWATAQSQTAEFESFSACRLAAGLDPSLEYVGWGAPVPCRPAAPVLPVTGPSDGAVTGAALAATLLLGVGILLAARRRARAE